MRRQQVPQGKWRLIDYLRNYRFNSIFLKNFGIITLLIILPLTVINYGYSFNAQRAMENEIIGIERQSLEKSADVMDAIFKEVYELAYSFASDVDTRLFMLQSESALRKSAETGGSWSRNTLVADLHERIRFFTTTYRYIDSIYLYAENSGLVLYSGDLVDVGDVRDNSWLGVYEQMSDESFRIESRRKNDSYPYFITFICPAKYLTGRLGGAVVINLNIEQLGAFINGNHFEEQQMYIADSEGHILYDNNYRRMETERLLPQPLTLLDDTTRIMELEDDTVVVASVPSQVQSLRYLSIRPMSYYESRRTEPLDFTLRMAIVSLVLSVAVTFIITLATFSPIRNLLSAVDRPIALERSMDKERQKDEVEHIKDILYATRSTNRRLTLELEERMDKLNNAQLRALQNQINPHFLYNTLDAVRWAAIDRFGGENEISDMIAPLAQLMRVSLECQSYLVLVREEIEHVKLYLRIFDIRYQGRVNVLWQIDPQILDRQIIKLSLQPLVENAIHHGLRPRRYRGTLLIEGSMEAGNVRISVTDDGVGMDEAHLEELNRHMQTQYLFDDRYVGIRNVNQRFKLIYGEAAGIRLSVPQQGGLCVTLLFPAQAGK